MLTRRHPGVRGLALGALMACLAVSAHARVNFSFGLNLGFPVGPAYGAVYGPGYDYAPGYGYGSYVNAVPSGAVSVQVGGGRYWRHGGVWYRPWGPRFVIVAPPVVVGETYGSYGTYGTYGTYEAPPPQPVTPSRSAPVIYPRNGQGPEQTESDTQECNRWAASQPAALADSSVFLRAVEACMDGRGYTTR